MGITLDNLTHPQSAVAGQNIYASGDGNQEDTDNLSPLNWQPLQGCYHFELNEEPVRPAHDGLCMSVSARLLAGIAKLCTGMRGVHGMALRLSQLDAAEHVRVSRFTGDACYESRHGAEARSI